MRWGSLAAFEKRIVLAFALLAALGLGVVALSVIALRQVVVSKDVVAFQHAAALTAIERMRFAAEKKVASTRAFLLSGSEKFVTRGREARGEFYAALGRLSQLTLADDERQLVGRIEPQERRHQETMERIIARRAGGALREAMISEFESELIPRHEALDATLSSLAATKETHLGEAQARSVAISNEIMRTFTGTAVGATALVLGLGVIVARLLANRRKAERRLLALHEELERRAAALAASNEELEAFSYSVSHDLRSPLRGVDGFSKALLEDYGDRLDATGRDYLNRVRAGTQRMGKLIDDLLGLSRVTRAELRRGPVDLSALAAASLDGLRLAEPGRKVELRVEPGLTAEGDPDLLRIALENLLSNAWKFTSRRELARIEVGLERRDGERVLYVRDNGAGFDMAYAGKLFGAFQRLHGAWEFSGTGIGLATVRRIIARHGGRIWARGEVDKGATIYFTLPELQAEHQKAA